MVELLEKEKYAKTNICTWDGDTNGALAILYNKAWEMRIELENTTL
jgi:hypothetical protein